MQLLILSAVQGGQRGLPLYHQLISHGAAAGEPGIQPVQQQLLRHRRHLHLLGHGDIPLHDCVQQTARMVPASDAQGGVLLRPAANAANGADIAGHGHLRQNAYVQLPGRDRLRLYQQQSPRGPDELCGRQLPILCRAGKGYGYRQTAKTGALLRCIQHGDTNCTGHRDPLLRGGFLPDIQLPAGGDDPRHVGAVFRNGGLHCLLMADRRVTCLFPAGQICKL